MFARISLSIALLLACAPAGAQVSKSATIAHLLEVGWETKPDDRAQAERLYRQGVEDLPGNRQIVYAYALVKLQQRQYPEAARLLDQYLGIEKQDVHAWRAKAWVSMLMKNATVSLVELDKISLLLADEKVKVPEAERQELLMFVGRMLGFLEGPGEGSVNAATLAAAKRKIADRLTETQREAFQQGFDALVDEFMVLASAKDDAQAQDIATAEKQKRERLIDLDKEEVDIGARKEELKLVAEKIQSEAAAENESYAVADRPLADEVSRLSSQVASVDRELSIVSGDIFSLSAQAAREKDPFIRNRIFADIDRLEIIASRLDNELRALQRRGRALQQQRAVLATRHAQAQAGFAASLGTAQKEYKTLENKEKRADAERTKLRKPATGNTGKVISLSKYALALTTYESFPLEAEKQRLLDQLEEK